MHLHRVTERASGKLHGKKRKSSQLRIRINASDHDGFVKLCDELDTTATRRLCRFKQARLAEDALTPDADQSDKPAAVSVPT
jgi:hypothetical protein